MPRNWLVLRIWLSLMVMAVSLTGTSVFAQGGTVVRVDPATLSAKVNDSVNLAIKVDQVANLTALELHLSFNPGVLEVVSVTNGGFVAADFTAQNTFDNAAGTLDYAVAQMNRAPAQGSGTLLTITFRAKANGSSTVALRATQAVPSGLLLSDQNGLSIPASWANGSVNVGSSNPATATPVTPAPATATPIPAKPATATPVTPAPGVPTSTSAPAITSQPVTATPTSAKSPTATPLSPTPVPVGAIMGSHVVRFGESLYCIGRAYKVTPTAIATLNGLWWPNLIFPNQVLLIPNVRWSPIPVGPVCQPQFVTAVPTTSPVPTVVPTTAATVMPPAATLTPLPTTVVVPPSACRAYYVVNVGDTLYNIATRYGTNYAEIARVNQLSNPRLIYVGQQLCIP